MLKHQKSKHSK